MEDCSEKNYGCDMHKRYSVFRGIDQKGNLSSATRVEHNRESVRQFLKRLPQGSQIAVETVGNWYWMIDEMEAAGHAPQLTNARKAKMMMCQKNKTDKLDAGGLAKLLHNGTLPVVWIPPAHLRDLREICRYRMYLSHLRTGLKNRIHATLAKYLIEIKEVDDIFRQTGREILKERILELPPETLLCVTSELERVDELQAEIDKLENRISTLAKETPEIKLLMTIPGIGKILATVIWLEIGDIKRFPSPSRLASYCGLVPVVSSSGGKTYLGHTSYEASHYLNWAFVEAGNTVARYSKRWNTHCARLYKRIKAKGVHAKAVVAVGRHFSEAAWVMLTKNEEYREPKQKKYEVSSTLE